MSKESVNNISIMCPNLTCRKVLMVPQNCRGKTVRCRACGTNIRVPSPKLTDPAPAPTDKSHDKSHKAA